MRQIANAARAYAGLISGYSSKAGNMMLNFASGIASFDNSVMVVEIGKHDFDVYYVPAEHTEKRSWDDYYRKGNIYFKDFANPVKIEPPEANESNEVDDYDLMPSGKYRVAMRTRVLEQAFNTGSAGMDLMEKLLLANLGAMLLIAIVLAFTLS